MGAMRISVAGTTPAARRGCYDNTSSRSGGHHPFSALGGLFSCDRFRPLHAYFLFALRCEFKIGNSILLRSQRYQPFSERSFKVARSGLLSTNNFQRRAFSASSVFDLLTSLKFVLPYLTFYPRRWCCLRHPHDTFRRSEHPRCSFELPIRRGATQSAPFSAPHIVAKVDSKLHWSQFDRPKSIKSFAEMLRAKYVQTKMEQSHS